jgi:hypothetical protein
VTLTLKAKQWIIGAIGALGIALLTVPSLLSSGPVAITPTVLAVNAQQARPIGGYDLTCWLYEGPRQVLCSGPVGSALGQDDSSGNWHPYKGE